MYRPGWRVVAPTRKRGRLETWAVHRLFSKLGANGSVRESAVCTRPRVAVPAGAAACRNQTYSVSLSPMGRLLRGTFFESRSMADEKVHPPPRHVEPSLQSKVRERESLVFGLAGRNLPWPPPPRRLSRRDEPRWPVRLVLVSHRH